MSPQAEGAYNSAGDRNGMNEPTQAGHHSPHAGYPDRVHRAGSSDLPVELIQAIFDRTFPPHYLLDPALEQGPNSPWCRTLRDKKSAMLVCSSWRDVCVPLVYEHVSLRSVGQLVAFLRTLKGSSLYDLKKIVKSVAIVCSVPDACKNAVQSSAVDILAMCSEVKGFTYSPFLGAHTDDFYDSPETIGIDQHLPSSITSLALGRHVPASISVFQCLGRMPLLSELSLYVGEGDFPTSDDSHNIPEIELPNLHTLSLSLERPFRLQIIHRLSTPSLTRLSLTLSKPNMYQTGTLFTELCDIVANKGRSLQYLALEMCIMNMSIAELIQHCPMLEHFVLSGRASLTGSHPTLRFLDICNGTIGLVGSGPDLDYWFRELWLGRLDVSYLRASYPNLQSARVLDFALYHIPGLLDALPPRLGDAEGNLRLRLLDMVIWDTPNLVIAEQTVAEYGLSTSGDLEALLPQVLEGLGQNASEYSDDLEDSTYEPSGSPSSVTSYSLTGSGGSHEPEAEYLDAEEILSIFNELQSLPRRESQGEVDADSDGP
ncbi:hypothetical protein GLOTRDRAFT_132882 [Gloeophyllum trabeum ATCC 11539]|uniref:Uncharacterized protein n=1 Tax=Gloeophyllum trabeum (strain ATCC 11539 / FP-39264 / Madison 617) TaxID=670483 RepID=S7RG76_GLOTA|nr:uncharacterized protein GLOTRDRAFT_132882 [Gloeophyllum trabeum ATCC 11539]EPQ51514.1 hypothetical protein GLOTRDRAFT_132882 [Gloeophyllum trabeum ATCC 11539]